MDPSEMLRECRDRAGLSQTELARRAGTSQAAIARYESAAVAPSLATLERLLAACGRRLTLGNAPLTTAAAWYESPVREHRRDLLALARRHGARNVRVFGSTARGEARPDSDIDLLVDLERNRTLLDLVALRREAGALLGRSVDVTTLDMLREPVRREAERDAVPV